MSLLFEILAVAALILLNAFFVAAEYGLVTSRRTRIEELSHEGNRRERRVLDVVSDRPRRRAGLLAPHLLPRRHRRARAEGHRARAFGRDGARRRGAGARVLHAL